MSDPEFTVIAPAQNFVVYIPYEGRGITIAEESYLIVVGDDMILGSKKHTVGDSITWTVDYGVWLANAAAIAQFVPVSSSTTLTVSNVKVLGEEATFLLSGGALNEQATVTVTMTDTNGNIKNDTIQFTVVAP